MNLKSTTLLLALLALLVGCVAVAPAQQAAVPVAAPTTTSLAGHLWLVADAAALVAGVPPLPTLLPEPPPPPPDAALLEQWREPASRWMEAELRAITAEWSDPPHAARALMLLGVAMNDALVVAEAARAQGLEVSDHAASAEAASRVLAYTHPLLDGAVSGERETATWAGVWRGEATVAGVLNGRNLGAAVADQVLAWAAADGAANPTPLFVLPAVAPGVWAPTAPDYELPQEPSWSRVRTVAIGDPASVRTPAPPAWGSSEMEAQLTAFAEAQAALTDEQRTLVRTWASGAGTITPPGLWVRIAQQLVATHKLAPAEAAGLYAALGVALHDAAVACWESKYHYMLARPVQALRERNPAFAPLLKTPPHPSYPSGHASVSGAASELLAAAFPEAAAALRQQASDAARSRVYGGIHWPIDGEAGLAQGARVAQLVLGKLED